MVGKDKIVLNCILFKDDLATLKLLCEEYHVSLCHMIRNIVNEYCFRIRYYQNRGTYCENE